MVSYYCFVTKAGARWPGAAASVERRRRERRILCAGAAGELTGVTRLRQARPSSACASSVGWGQSWRSANAHGWLSSYYHTNKCVLQNTGSNSCNGRPNECVASLRAPAQVQEQNTAAFNVNAHRHTPTATLVSVSPIQR